MGSSLANKPDHLRHAGLSVLASKDKLNLRFTNTIIPTSPTAIADTGTTGHFLRELPNRRPLQPAPPLKVKLPDGHHINSTGTTSIDWLDLPPGARTAHVRPQLDPHSLISIGVLCDHNCIATFDKESVQIHQHSTRILQGHRLPNGLWSLPLSSHQPQANTLFPEQTQRDLVRWLHAAAFSPSISTFLEATERNFFATWPNLTPQVIRRYLQPSVATSKVHLNQQRQRRRKLFNEEPQPTPITPRTHTIYATLVDPKQPTGNSFSDLTGRFPIQSNLGANYIFVLYDYDSNAIIVRPLRNRSSQEIQRVFTTVHAYLVAHGLRPRLHTLDNEASTNIKDFLTAKKV